MCRRHRVPIGSELGLGRKLDVTPNYFNQAHGCVLEIGVMLGHVLWRKMFPDRLLDADKHLNRVCYELLVEQRYNLAARLLDFAARTLKRFGSEELRRTMVVNRAQAYKWLGEEDKCKAIMTDEDWSASQDAFRLADAVLRDDVEESTRIMRRIGPSDDVVEKESYRDWPLFRSIRKEELFRKTYREIFGEPLEQVRVEAPGEPDSGRSSNAVKGEEADKANETNGVVH